MTTPIRALPALALLAFATACLDVSAPRTSAAGFLTQSAHSDGAAGYVSIPEAIFYANVNLEVTAPPTDACVIRAVGTSSDNNPTLPTLDAGPVVFTRIGVREDTLLPGLSAGQLSYRPRVGDRIPFTPGDSMEMTVPGGAAGFPSVSLKARTSEAFTHDPVPVPATAQDINLTWTPAPAPGSRLIFSLQYATILTAGDVDTQIYCGFVDDGAGTVPAALVNGWINALDGRRSVRATRFRFHEVNVGSNQRFTFVSTFTLPLPPIPSGF